MFHLIATMILSNTVSKKLVDILISRYILYFIDISGFGKRSQVRDFFIKRYLKQTSLIEGKAMITVTNIDFYDIEGYGT